MASLGPFAELLRQLLKDSAKRLQIPESQLVSAIADDLAVSRDLIHRWKTGTRIPPLDKDYVLRIIQFLELDQRTSNQLEQAQVSALKARSAHATHAAIRKIVSGSGARSGDIAQQSAQSMDRVPSSAFTSGHIHGRANVLRTATLLVQQSCSRPPSGSQAIVMSMQSQEPWWSLPEAPDLEEAWTHALRDALAHGWRIVQLHRLQQIERTLHLVEPMIKLACYGDYQPYYFPEHGVLRPPYDILAIPGCGAMTMLATSSAIYVDSAFIHHAPEQVQIVQRHFQQQLAHAKPLLHSFRSDSQELEFTRALVKAEGEPGGRRFAKEGLSALTLPPEWFTPDSSLAHGATQSGFVHQEHLTEYLALLQERWDTFTRNVRSHLYFDVCPRRRLEQMIEEGRFPDDEAVFGRPASIELRTARARHLVSMLRSFENYQLALVEDSEAVDFSLETIGSWMVTRHRVFLLRASGVSDSKGKPLQVNLEITHPSVVAAFRDYFDSLWQEHIALECKDKHEHIWWLEERLRKLEEQLR